ncbi:MAG TPA: LysM peptidoglycan-binding domain-containing protein [Rhodocyclaceae bacterium]|nr:LysM peptidoglycan-binding domain-containing protein [Rhodocyclaceae bacterium]
MRRIIAALLLSASTAWVVAQDAKPVELQPDAPDRHIVVRGDTLWGIASQFLKDPYRWPEIWHLNQEQIKNPQRIYPGQVIVLDRSGGEPRLKIGALVKAEPKIYSQEISKEIPAIPQDQIEPFLSQPLVVEEGALDSAARVVATQESRVYVGAGNVFYASGATEAAKLWNIYRPGRDLKDPDNDEVIGHEAVFLGSARKIADGKVATFEIVTSKLEMGQGDRLLPAPRVELISYVPHAPQTMIKGRVISLYGGVGEAGPFSIVALSRGKRDGLEVGHVLALYRAGKEVTNRIDLADINKLEEDKAETYQLPDERYGLVFVFRVFDRIAYALVMNVTRPVASGDAVRTP